MTKTILFGLAALALPVLGCGTTKSAYNQEMARVDQDRAQRAAEKGEYGKAANLQEKANEHQYKAYQESAPAPAPAYPGY